MRAWLDDQRSAGSSVPTLWSGMEISALLKGCLVHVLALGFELDHPALRLYNHGDAVVGEPLRAASVVAAIHEAGGLAVLAHPARYRLGHDILIAEAARLGFELDHPALRLYNHGDAVVGEPLRAASVVEAIHEAGGLAVLAHPARYRLGHEILIAEAANLGFDGGEAWYDYDMQTAWSPSPLICESIDRQLENLGLLRTCGTDSHGIDLGGR